MSGGTLTVALSGEVPKGWPKRFKGVLALLEHGDRWGKVDLHKGTIRVHEVRQGSEEELRRLLEGIVVQVNTDFESNAAQDDDACEADAEADPEAERDKLLTDLFRSFAEPANGKRRPRGSTHDL